MTQKLRPAASLTDRTGFWLGLAAVLAALGGVGFAVAVAEYRPPWGSAWFISGAVLCVIGCLAALWALVLYVGHKVAGAHWCPDPRAHLIDSDRPLSGMQMSPEVKLRRPSPAAILRATVATKKVEISRWLHPLLREMNGDLRQATKAIERMIAGDTWGAVTFEFNLEDWEKFLNRLAELPDRDELYDSMRDAYAHICRLQRISQESSKRQRAVTAKASDDLEVALRAIRKAKEMASKELSESG